ncbi:MAG: hypothetical protein ACI82Z_000364 [Cellvibrionaceae bacterium]|jgi:hypothetical protein
MQMKKNKYGLSFVIFGLICLITAWVLSSHTGDTVKQSFPSTGGKFGPIKIHKKNEVVEIKIAKNVGNRSWSAIEAKVVDAKDNYLFAFSEELWFETGRDAEGPWQEGKTNYDISVTFPKPGNYFINFNSTNSGSSEGNIRVEANKKLGSSIAYKWIGFISLIMGLAIHATSTVLYESGNDRRKTGL